MKPQNPDYFQTYVSQYVPQPFELMQRAVDRKQQHYDAIAKNLEDQKTFLGKLSAYRGADTQELGEIRDVYSEELDKILNSGDLTQREEQVRKLGTALGQDFTSGRLGELVQGHALQQEYDKLISDPTKLKETHSATDMEYMQNLDQEDAIYGGGRNELQRVVQRGMGEKQQQAFIKERKLQLPAQAE